MHDLEGKRILITGSAGFIGFHLIKRIYKEAENVKITGLDNLNDYYDRNLKEYRLKNIQSTCPSFEFILGNIADRDLVYDVFQKYEPDIVIHLAAQAGVRYSITNPNAYLESNLIGFFNIIEACRHSYDNSHTGVRHFVFASSSSVYGMNQKIPYSTEDKVDDPVSLYAATKKADELLAHAYSRLYHIPSTGLRFFTVYGPAGRPDMAYFNFADKLRAGKNIQIFNYGNCKRDFTYIDDVVEGIIRVIPKPPRQTVNAAELPIPPYKIYNIGKGHPESLLDFVQILCEELIKANVLPKDYDFEKYKEFVPMQPGDVPITYADTAEFEQDFEFRPGVGLREGLRRFSEWYADFYTRYSVWQQGETI